MNNWLRTASLMLVIFTCGLTGCASNPATRYYTLFPAKNTAPLSTPDTAVSLGIGPIILPEYMDQLSIVSLTESTQLHIASHDAWAGNLKNMVTRVMVSDISRLLNNDAVWAFPWDNRQRPDYQIRVVFEEFSGQRGGDMMLRAKWSLSNKTGDKLYLVRVEEFVQATRAEDVASYVQAMNLALNKLSLAVAEGLVEYLAVGK